MTSICPVLSLLTAFISLCKGSLKQIFEFYKALQGLDRLVRIEQVKLVNDNDFSGRVSMHTEAVIYYRAGATQG